MSIKTQWCNVILEVNSMTAERTSNGPGERRVPISLGIAIEGSVLAFGLSGDILMSLPVVASVLVGRGCEGNHIGCRRKLYCNEAQFIIRLENGTAKERNDTSQTTAQVKDVTSN
jgi:hypothetical protein